MENFKLGTFLKKERERQHLSSRELAERTKRSGSEKGLSASHINKIENGKTYPTFQTLQRLAEALRLPLVLVLDGSGANPDTVTIISTSEMVSPVLHAFNREELVELLLICQELTDKQIQGVLSVARTFRGITTSTNDLQ